MTCSFPGGFLCRLPVNPPVFHSYRSGRFRIVTCRVIGTALPYLPSSFTGIPDSQGTPVWQSPQA